MQNKLNLLYIDETKTIVDAIKQLNKNGTKFLAVIGKRHKYLGSLTDADIRRYYLKGLTATTPVSKVCNKKSKFIYFKRLTDLKVKQIFKNNAIDALPILNKDKTIKNIILRKNYLNQRNKKIDFSCLLLAGGLGKRLLPLTSKTPKPLISFEDVPYLINLINKLIYYNVNTIYISVYYKKERIINLIKKEFYQEFKRKKIIFLIEKKPLGTAGCLKLLTKEIKNLLIINSDIIFNFDLNILLKFHYRMKNFLTVACQQIETKIPFGVIKNNKFQIKKINEKPSFNYLINSGIYLTNSKIKNFLNRGIQSLDMPDLINKLIHKKEKVGLFPLKENIIDFGTQENLEIAKKDFKKYFYG